MRAFILAILLVTGFNVVAQHGWWSAKLYRADGNVIAFTFEWKTLQGKPVWYIKNAAEKIKVDNIKEVGDSLFIQMPVFESQFRIKKTNKELSGVWIKGGSLKTQVIPFSAAKSNQRFLAGVTSGKNISGNWAVSFSKSKLNQLSVGIFKQLGNQLTGTFLNPTGDYRYLEGIVKDDSLFLSAFDGGHCFLFTAKIADDKTITGGAFFSGATSKEDWSAVKNANAKVPGDSVAMFVKPGEESLDFSFKDLEGKQVAINSDRFKNKVVIIQLMGSWCPNCMDETAFLSAYYNANKQRGVEVIALAYEYSTDWDRSVKSLKKFQQRFNVQYPILNTEVTVSDSLRTEKTLPQVTAIKFFPSSIIIDKKGKIRKLDTGFNGPATGAYYVAYKKEFYDTVDKLLKENL
jgi:peroxiredoxin